MHFYFLAARGESTIACAPRYCGQDQGAKRRRCRDIADDEQRRDWLGRRADLDPAIPARPKGSGGAEASAALGTRPIVLSPRAARRLMLLRFARNIGARRVCGLARRKLLIRPSHIPYSFLKGIASAIRMKIRKVFVERNVAWL
jgi:hypothetical protein